MSDKSKLVVLDGLDGSGKTTQFELLLKHFQSINLNYKGISFPDYDMPSSTLVKMYLGGQFSKTANGVNAYAASSFYAVDRYASYKLFWEDNYNKGDFILASRYVSSNAIHQMVKLDKNDWDAYLDWLEDYEYIRLGLPRPCKVIFLDMPVEISQKLLNNRYNGDNNKKDIHESDIDYLLKCRESALYAAKRLNWCVVPCSKNDEARQIKDIFNDILSEINSFLV